MRRILSAPERNDFQFADPSGRLIHGRAFAVRGVARAEIQIVGGDGDDSIEGGAEDDVLVGGGGADTLTGLGGRDQLYSHVITPDFGYPYNGTSLDTLAEQDSLSGGDGDDFLFAGYGDSVDGGANDVFGDRLYISFLGAPAGVTADFRLLTNQPAIVIGGGTYTNIETVAYFEGSEFDDLLAPISTTYYPIASPIYGRGGNDHIIANQYSGWAGAGIYGGDGDDTIDNSLAGYAPDTYGEAGNDTIIGGGSYDMLDGGIGDDIIQGNYGYDTLLGGSGDDVIDGGNFGDVIYGGADDDTIYGAGDGDSVEGGDGDDLIYGDYSLISSANGVSPLTNHDYLYGEAGDDTIYGDQGDDRIEGGDDDDILDGGTGHDRMWGGSGHDVITDSSGDDQILGETGADSISVTRQASEAASTISIDGGDDEDVITFFGARFVDDVTILGGGGDDHISTFRGLSVAIDAGAGADRVALNFLGADHVVTLGSGMDILSLPELIEPLARDGDIVVTDMETGDQGDRLELVLHLASVLTSWDGYANPFATQHLQLVQDGADAVLRIDADGLGAGAAFEDLVRFQNRSIADFTTYNLGGFAPDGAPPAAATIVGTPGPDLIWGSFNPELIQALGGDDEIYGGAGDDRIEGGDDRDWLFGQLGNDLLFGGGGNDLIYGNGGQDLIDGGGGADAMAGGAGNDVYYVDHAFDAVGEAAGAGHDIVYAELGYTLGSGREIEILSTRFNHGTDAIDLIGNEFANILIGNAGANALNGRGGADDLRGLAGDDIYYVDHGGDIVREGAGGGTDIVYAETSYALAAGQEIEMLSTRFNAAVAAINLTGNELANILIGNAGANVLFGGGGADDLRGLAGDDIYYVDHAGDIVREEAGGGQDRIYTTISLALAAGQEVEMVSTRFNFGTEAISLTGNDLANLLVGNAGANRLFGGGGADDLRGLLGDDIYYVDIAGDIVREGAGGGHDIVYAEASYALAAGQEVEILSTRFNHAANAIDLAGNALANILIGNAGANTLDGKGGHDDLRGLAGADTFAFTAALGANNVDLIRGFSAADDTIAIDNAVFTGLAAGALAPGAFRTGAAAADADDRIVYNSATGALLFDADGNGAGAAIQFATLEGAPAITAGDFLVI